MLNLAVERPLYEWMSMLLQGHQEDRTGPSGALLQHGVSDFRIHVPRPGAWWVVAQGSRPGFIAPDLAFPLVGPLADVVLPPIRPERGASCRLRLLEPAVAWVAPGRVVRQASGRAGGFPHWGPWRPWMRLDSGGRDRDYWLDQAGDPVSPARAVRITIGAPGHRPLGFDCSSGALVEVSLEPDLEPRLDLRLLIATGKRGGVVTGQPLPAAILVDGSGWPVASSDEFGSVAIPSGSYRVLAPSGGEWRLRVEESGTRTLSALERSVLVSVPVPADEFPATAIAIHWSGRGDVLGTQGLEPVETLPGVEHGARWTVSAPPGAVETTILASGYEMEVVDWSLGQNNVELRPFRSLDGVVLAGETGDPVEGAQVALHGTRTGRLAHVATTASNGTFRIEAAEAQNPPHLIVRAEGYRSARVDLDQPDSASGPGAIVVRLARAAALFGRIVSPSGEGVAGSVALIGRHPVFPAPSVGPVSLFVRSNPSLHDLKHAGRDGLFRFPEVTPAARSVAVGAPGYATRFLSLRSGSEEASEVDAWTGWHDLGQVVLEPELAVEGIVIDRAGVPLAGAAVDFGRSPDVRGALSLGSVALPTGATRSDAEGRFRVGGLGHGDLVDVVVGHPGYVREERLRVSVDQTNAPGWLEIALDPALELRGRIVDQLSGKSIEGARVRLSDGSENRQSAVERTGSEGRFTIRGLPALRGSVRVEAFGYAPLRYELTDDDRLRLAAGDGLVMALRRGDATVRGVVKSGGGPVVGALVQLNTKERATTDGAGRFELAGLPVGQSMVFCWPRGDESGQPIMWYRDIGPGTTELVLDLTSVRVEGWVEDPTGLPIGGAAVRISRPLAPDGEARTEPDGSFRIHVTPGSYRASVGADGYSATSREVEVGTNEPPPIVFRLEAAREVRARVVGLKAEEAAMVEVRIEPTPLSPAGGGRLKRSAHELGGTPVFTGHNPPTGTVVLVATVPSSDRMQRRTVDVRPRGVTEVEIAFDDAERNGRLSGLVTVDGTALAGAPVFVIDERAGDAWAVRTDHRGMYAMDGLRRGRVEIAAVGERRALRVDGESVADFRARSAVLAGRVVLEGSGRPVAGLEVVAFPAHTTLEIAERVGQTAVSLSSEEGRFLINRLFQVPYRVVARRHGGRVVGSAAVDLGAWTGETLIAVRDAEQPR